MTGVSVDHLKRRPARRSVESAKTNAALLWSMVNVLRPPFQLDHYGDVVLPFTILRRLDAILAPTKDKVLAEYNRVKGLGVNPGIALNSKFSLPFTTHPDRAVSRLAE